MEFKYRYHGNSSVSSNAKSSSLSFAPDTLRPPTFFVGELKQHIAFREAISALHSVVVSDMRFQPKDQTEYKRWLAQEEERLLAEFMQRHNAVNDEIKQTQTRLAALNQQSSDVLQPYYNAQNKYFKYLYKNDYDAWFVLDPVITVNPDEVFFECFSEDESSYGKLSCNYNVFNNISETACGTTNIDYSVGLYNEFQKIREYKTTSLAIDPDGFNVQTTGEEAFEEVKIDLPESWVRGFLQVSSAMTLPMVKLTVAPMDIYNLCYRLRRNKERVGPRSLKFKLESGKPIRVECEPWGDEIVFPRSIYTGNDSREIRIWGRRRLHILERLIPIAKSFDIHLMGNGMPSFYVADLGDMSFTLGLSGWSANDWSRQGNFDLLAPRADVDEITLKRVYKGLSEVWQASSRALAQQLQIDETLVKSALSIYSQSGQVLYDLSSDVYRIRELSREPLPLESLRFANERDEKSARFVEADLVKVTSSDTHNGKFINKGTVMDDAKEYTATLVIDEDERLIEAKCNCFYFQKNQLRLGPCEHILAVRKKVAETK